MRLFKQKTDVFDPFILRKMPTFGRFLGQYRKIIQNTKSFRILIYFMN